MMVIGIDPGSQKAGIAVVISCRGRESVAHELFRRKSKESLGAYFLRLQDRLRELAEAMPAAIACEATHVRTKRVTDDKGKEHAQVFAGAHGKLNQCVGVVRMAAEAAGANYCEVHPSEWRRGVCGKGAGPYDFVRASLRQQLQDKSINEAYEDELAAISIGLVTIRRLVTEEKIRLAAGRAS